MANIDKKIGIFPETATSGYPRIEFTGSGNIPITIETLDDNSLNFFSSSGVKDLIISNNWLVGFIIN